MDTKKLLGDYVKSRTGKLDSYPDIVKKGLDTIQGSIPFKLKLAIVLSELITFSSHLRKPIMLHDGTKVPTNAIVFALAGSGVSKDKSLNAVRKSLSFGYSQIEDQRKGYAREKAEHMALLEEDSAENWARYYVEPKALQAGLGTVEGLTQHFCDIASNPTGAGSIMSSEIGSELQTNGIMVDIIKTVAVAYDLGNIASKIVKSNDNQTGSVEGLPINALFFGSHEGLLYDNAIKNKFKLVFNTQLARRSIFAFTPESPEQLSVTSIDGLYEEREKERARSRKAQNALNDLTGELVGKTTNDPLVWEDDTQKLFDVYLEYNILKSNEVSNKFPISKLSRRHKQWLALKLSGTYAILDGSLSVKEEHYAYAINTIELLAGDLSNFEYEMVKEPYELLSDMCRDNAEDGTFLVSLHDLRKSGYVAGTGSSKSKVDELCMLAGSYDKEGLYSQKDGGIEYKQLVKTDIVGVSFKVFENLKLKGKELKDYMARNSTDGYEFRETDFENLEDLLEFDCTYSCFQFRDGVHSKEHLTGGTKFVIIDVDKSVITDEEAHTLLEEYNHIIARTSDVNNEFKFRILLELDAVVDIDPITWKAFIQEIATELGLIADPVPQSQIFLGYKDRNILKQFGGNLLDSKVLIDRAINAVKDKPQTPDTLSAKEKKSRLDNPRDTFAFAYECGAGERSNKIYRALAYAVDLGADAEYVESLALEINSYISSSMDIERLNRTLITPALRRIR